MHASSVQTMTDPYRNSRRPEFASMNEGVDPQWKMTDEEVEALMTLVRGGWLKLELNL